MNRKKLLSAVLVLVLCASLLSGCFYNPKKVMTVNGTDVTCGQYLFEQFQAVQMAVSAYGDSTVTGTAVYNVDIDGTPARDWINDKTLELCKYLVFIEQEYDRLGLTADASTESYASYMASYYWQNYSTTYLANGVSYDTFKDMIAFSDKESSVITKLYGAGGEKAFSEADKQAYFEKNYTRFDYVNFPVKDSSSGYSLGDTVIATVKEVAQAMSAATTDDELKQLYLANYGKINEAMGSTDAVDETTFSSAFIKSALLYTNSGSFSDAFTAEVLAATDNNFHLYVSDDEIILYRAQPLTDADTEATYDSTIVKNMAIEPFKAYSDEVIAGYTVDVNERARKYYSLDKVKM